MKKIFYLCVVALVVMATSCKKSDTSSTNESYSEDVNQWYIDMNKIDSFIGQDVSVALQYFREKGLVFKLYDYSAWVAWVTDDNYNNNEYCEISCYSSDGKVNDITLTKYYDNQKNKAKSICIQIHNKFYEKYRYEYKGVCCKSDNWDKYYDYIRYGNGRSINDDDLVTFENASEFEKNVNSYDKCIHVSAFTNTTYYSSDSRRAGIYAFFTDEFGWFGVKPRIMIEYSVGL